MICHRSLPFALLTIVALLGGCAGGKPPAATTEVSGGSASGEGIYKIGLPYNIDGTWYYPAANYSYDETGIASWYGEEFHGRYTANGEIFDANVFSAAHPTLPMPTIVQVTNLENGRTLVLRVNDRGPFVGNRVIDVSRAAASALGFEGQGTAKVRVKILVPESIQVALLARRNGGDEDLSGQRIEAAPRIPVAARPLPPDIRLATAEQTVPPPPPAIAPPTARTVAALPSVGATVPARPRQIYVQAGAFAQAENAQKVRQRLDPLGPVTVAAAKANGADFYRVRLGPFASRSDADKALQRVVGAGFGEARIVSD
jgi:rare lipoprotein A